jgi:hypothetical protein
VLVANTAAKDHEFWAEDLPVAEAVAFAGVRLAGHQQVTDAYLLGLSNRRGVCWPRSTRGLARSPNPSRPSARRWKSWIERG